PAHYEHKIGVDNVVNGKPVGYFIRHNNSVVDGSEYGQIVVVASRLLTVRGGEFFNAGEGVRVAFCEGVTIDSPVVHGGEAGLFGAWSSNCTVVGGEFSRALEAGIMLFGCSEWNVLNNNVTGNLGGGILLHNSSSNTLVGNAVLFNDAGGLFIQANSSGNLLYGNLFGWNGIPNARDDGADNHWNSTQQGNYWSDYGGATHQIEGLAEAIDYHPIPLASTIVVSGRVVPITQGFPWLPVIVIGVVSLVIVSFWSRGRFKSLRWRLKRLP
ncbi:MAG: right-handed parallel beta-helix repeat-containing protein, partial [Candidatus Thorarchaeota archaeon]